MKGLVPNPRSVPIGFFKKKLSLSSLLKNQKDLSLGLAFPAEHSWTHNLLPPLCLLTEPELPALRFSGSGPENPLLKHKVQYSRNLKTFECLLCARP